MEDLIVVNSDSVPTLANGFIISTKINHTLKPNSSGTFSLKNVLERYNNGICRCSTYGNVYFERILIEDNIIEYRRWFQNGKRKNNHFEMILPSGEKVKDGPLVQWSEPGEKIVFKLYAKGKLTYASRYDSYGAKVQTDYNEYYIEELSEKEGINPIYTLIWKE